MEPAAGRYGTRVTSNPQSFRSASTQACRTTIGNRCYKTLIEIWNKPHVP
jgi:hypothetical protein